MDMAVSDDERDWEIIDHKMWCKENLRKKWFAINEVYFFLHKRDAMAFKLAWI